MNISVMKLLHVLGDRTVGLKLLSTRQLYKRSRAIWKHLTVLLTPILHRLKIGRDSADPRAMV